MDPHILRKLYKILAELYPEEPSIWRVAGDAGIDLSRLTLNSTSLNNWYSVLREAKHVHRVDELLSVAEDEYSTNESLQHACAAFRRAVDHNDRIDGDSRPSINEEKIQHIQRVSDNPGSRQTDEQGTAKHDKEPINNEKDAQQRLQVENMFRSHPDFIAILQKGDFVPREERKGRELTIVRPKVAVTCKLPISISKGSCLIEFSDSFLRGLTISLEHKDVLKQLIIGRHTPFQRNARKFIRMTTDGSIRLSIGTVEALLTQADALDLCECIDKVADVYIASILDAENTLEAWNRWIENYYPEDDHYGYEILSLSVETWQQMFQFANENSKSPDSKYEFYTTNSSIIVETGVITHAEIVPKPHITIDGFSGEYISLLYIPPEYDETWQNNIGPKGFWTANFTKNWVLKKWLPVLQNCDAKDRLDHVANPNVFWNINDPHLFKFHLDVIHRWVCTCIGRNKPTNLFINYCQAFSQLVNKAVIEDKSNMWGYVLQHVALLQKNSQNIDKNGAVSGNEKFQSILADNLKYLQRVEYISDNGLDYMFRGHCVLLRDFKISSTQSAINNFKKALWPLFERASFESRFTKIE